MYKCVVFSKGCWVLSVLLAGLFVTSAYGETLTQTLGDEDFFGFGGGVIGDDVPSIDFNNNTPSDPDFTDRDIRESVFGPDTANNVAWTHDLSTIIAGMTVNSAELGLAIGGIQDGNASLGATDDKLFIEGIEISGAFDTLDQGARGTSFIEFPLSGDQLASLETDSVLDIFFDGGKVPAGIPINGNAIESYFIDFSRVTVDVVPEPTSLTVFALSALTLLRRRNLFNRVPGNLV